VILDQTLQEGVPNLISSDDQSLRRVHLEDEVDFLFLKEDVYHVPDGVFIDIIDVALGRLHKDHYEEDLSYVHEGLVASFEALGRVFAQIDAVVDLRVGRVAVLLDEALDAHAGLLPDMLDVADPFSLDDLLDEDQQGNKLLLIDVFLLGEMGHLEQVHEDVSTLLVVELADDDLGELEEELVADIVHLAVHFVEGDQLDALLGEVLVVVGDL